MNWKHLSIPKKIALGFSVSIIIIIIMVVINFGGVSGLVTDATEFIEGNKLRGVLVQREADHLNWARGVNKLLADDNVQELTIETDHQKCGFGKFVYGTDRKMAEEIGPSSKSLFALETLPYIFQISNLFDKAILAEKRIIKGYYKAKEIFDKETLPSFKLTLSAIRKFKDLSSEMVRGMKTVNEIYSSQTEPTLKEIQNLLHQLNQETNKYIMTNDGMISTAQSTKSISTILGIIGIIICLFVSFFSARGITSFLTGISSHMDESAQQVAPASQQIATSSQTLAEGAQPKPLQLNKHLHPLRR
jgi:methyl-accepting chemotaxis protein